MFVQSSGNTVAISFDVIEALTLQDHVAPELGRLARKRFVDEAEHLFHAILCTDEEFSEEPRVLIKLKREKLYCIIGSINCELAGIYAVIELYNELTYSGHGMRIDELEAAKNALSQAKL